MNLNNSCGCSSGGNADSNTCGNKSTPAAALTLAITTVPMQPWEQPYEPAAALQHGTVFPCLDLPFYVTGGGR